MKSYSLRRCQPVIAVLSIALLIFASTSVALTYYFVLRKPSKSTASMQPAPSQYPLLANRIFAENPNDNILNFSPLRRELRNYFGGLNANYSFYMEYLPTGTSIKINQDNPMVGASLLKVPVVMNLLRAAERGEANLAQTVTIQEGDIDKRSGTLWQKGVGTRLTLKEVARYAIVESDNTAINMLIGAAAGKYNLFEQAINELDVELSVENGSQTTLGAQGYGSLLKCLYLSCFNTYSDSQLLLQWLSESNSPSRLRRDLPKDTKVAHKYGTSGGRSESDCGIVYIPKRPYIICVMVDVPPEEANDIIATASRMVYDYVIKVD